MRVPGGEELLMTGVSDVRQRFRELGPVEAEPHDHIARLDLHVGVKIPRQEGAELGVLSEKGVRRRLYPGGPGGVLRPAGENGLNAAIQQFFGLLLELLRNLPDLAAHIFQGQARERRRVVVHGAGGKIVRLVDHEVRPSLLIDADLRHPAEGRARREHIIVIADHDVRFPRSVQLQLEGADLVFLAQFPERARPELSFFRQNIEKAVLLDLAVVVPRVLAELRAAERLVLKTDLAFCRDRERLELCAGVLEPGNRVLGNNMLAVLGSDINDLLAPLKRVLQHGIEHAHGLPQTGRRLDQHPLLLMHSLFNRLHQLDLAGPRVPEGKCELR